MVKQDVGTVARPFVREDAPGDATAERVLAIVFLAALGLWLVLAFVLGTS